MINRLIFAVAAWIWVSPLAANAASQGQWDRCTKGQPEQRIVGCTQIIEGGQETTINLSSAHTNRASAYTDAGLFSAALADHNRAVELWPQNPAARTARGLTLLGS